MKNKIIKEIYEKRLFSNKPTLQDNDSQLHYILKYLDKSNTMAILDAGCGNGNYAYYLSNIGYKNISAVDLFNEISTKQFDYIQSSIENLPFIDNSFDFIYSNSVIFYLENPEDGLVEFNRVLKDEGVLLFSAHTKYSLFTLWRIFKRDILNLKSMEHLNGVRFYSANYYKKILEKNDFEIILQDGYNSSFILYPFYKKIVRGFEKYFKIDLPLAKPFINSGVVGKIKSEISYHSVFVARKIND